MNLSILRTRAALSLVAASLTAALHADPVVTRLNPPSGLFSYNDPNPPYVARFLPGQRFDLQATVQADAGQTITGMKFLVNGRQAGGASGLAAIGGDRWSGSLRAFSLDRPGVKTLRVEATQSDGKTAVAQGNFEIVDLPGISGPRARAKNVIFMIGDGMGIGHRTAARLMLHGVSQGKAMAPLAMDTFPYTGMVMTASLNSIVTDSAPGAACYSTGNKGNNNQEGVFPDDTADKFDNPRVELIGEYLARTQGKALGIVTTADVFDATPAAFGIHTQDRGAGTGICDMYLDETAAKGGLKVLLGGGRKWFLPNATPGSARGASTDYTLPAEVAAGWGVPAGAIDPSRNLIGDFEAAGFSYVGTATQLESLPAGTQKLLGLFAFSNMNIALDKIGGRRGTSTVVDDYGFPDQPMLDEMTGAALEVLAKDRDGFVLMVEAASIDKQAHNMDSERWMLDTIEFDRAIARCRDFAAANPGTLVIVTADHECAGANIIGASTLTNADLQTRAQSGGGAAQLRNTAVGTYDAAGFPVYTIAADGYPVSTDPDRKLLIGYAANADRYEDWLTNARPLRDSQQPFNGVPPLSTYPSGPLARDVAGNFLVTGQVPGTTAVHTGDDVPLSAFGRGASYFTGVMDNTDVFFRAMTAVLVGAPKDSWKDHPWRRFGWGWNSD